MTDGYGFEPHPAGNIYLSEVSPQDKPWDVHRAEADAVKGLYSGTFYDCYADRIAGCSGVLEFKFVVNPDNGEIRLKLAASRFCRVRHCPVCQWRRQMTWRARFFQALPLVLEDYPSCRFIFLTLTVRNCPVSELKATLAHMNQSWQRLSQRKQFPALGWLKSTEITREYTCTSPSICPRKGSKKGCMDCTPTDYAHPHFHAILMVNPSYFGLDYLSKQKWIELWRQSLRVDYDPSIAIRVVKSTGKSKESLDGELMKGFCEVLKYSLKPEDLVSDREWLLNITKQLHKTRAVAVGGVFKKYISEKEPEDLVSEDENPEDLSGLPIWFGWREAVARYCKIPDR